jgi:hypothetical protein
MQTSLSSLYKLTSIAIYKPPGPEYDHADVHRTLKGDISPPKNTSKHHAYQKEAGIPNPFEPDNTPDELGQTEADKTAGKSPRWQTQQQQTYPYPKQRRTILGIWWPEAVLSLGNSTYHSRTEKNHQFQAQQSKAR